MRIIFLLLLSFLLLAIVHDAVGPMLNQVLAEIVLGKKALPAEIASRLVPLYALICWIPLVLVYQRFLPSIEQKLAMGVYGMLIISIELALFFDTSWNTDEISALRWFQSLWLVFCSVACLLNFWLLRMLKFENKLVHFWAVLSGAFFYLALDERFHLHEKGADLVARLTESRIDQINGVFGITYFDSIVLLMYLFAGALLLVYFSGVLLQHYRGRTVLARRYFLIAVALGVSSVAVDLEALHFEYMEELEEFLEILCSATFLLAFLMNLLETGANHPFVLTVRDAYRNYSATG